MKNSELFPWVFTMRKMHIFRTPYYFIFQLQLYILILSFHTKKVFSFDGNACFGCVAWKDASLGYIISSVNPGSEMVLSNFSNCSNNFTIIPLGCVHWFYRGWQDHQTSCRGLKPEASNSGAWRQESTHYPRWRRYWQGFHFYFIFFYF